MTLIADVFPKLWTPKNVVRLLSKKYRLRGPFNKQHGKQAETLWKSKQQPVYHLFVSLRKQLSWKKSVLEIFRILRLFVNTLSADAKYSLLNRDNLTQPIQIQFFQKQIFFSDFSLHI